MTSRHAAGARRVGSASPVAPTSRVTTWWAALLTLSCVLTYWNSLWGPFILDDRSAIAGNAAIRNWRSLTDLLFSASNSSAAGRPLVNLSLAINYAIGGLAVEGYHAWNIGVHLLCALLLAGVVRRTLELPRVGPIFGERAVHVAFAAALIWMLHPLNSEVVDYVVQRTESMMALAYLLTLYGSIRAVSSTHVAGWQAVALLSCALGMTCKESMVTAPLMVVLFDRAFVFESFVKAWRHRWRFYSGLAATWIVLAALNWSGPRSGAAGFSTGVDVWTYLLNQTVVITHYLRLAVWPRSLIVFYGWPLPLTLGDVLPYAVLVAGLLLATVAAWFRRPGPAFLGIWFFVTLAPTSSILPISTEVGAERRMYLPLMALIVLAVVAASLVRDQTGRTRHRRAAISVGRALLAIVCGALAAGTIVRNREYSSAVTLARTVVERRPTSIAHHILGAELMAAGAHEEAVVHLREATRGDSRAHYDLGLELFNQGKPGEAIDELQKFLATWGLPYRLVPHWLEPPPQEVFVARIVLVRALAAEQRWPEVVEQTRPILAIEPTNLEILTRLGVALIATGQIDDAIAAFQKVVEAEPGSAEGQRNLANALADRGRGEEALAPARQAVVLAPENPGAYDVLGRALAIQGRLAEAGLQFERALEIDPAYEEARQNLSRVRQLQAAGR